MVSPVQVPALPAVAKKAGASACATQGVRLIAAGISALELKDADPLLIADWIETMAECTAELQKLHA